MRAAIGGGKAALGIQPRGALAAASGEGPLLRAQLVDQGVAETAVVEVAASGQALVFVKQRSRVSKGKLAGLARAQLLLQSARKVAHNIPVGTGAAGRRNRRAHVADAPFGIGDTAFLFAPAGGGQQQVGVAAGLGSAEGFLHDDKGAQAKRLVDQLLVRHGLGRVGTGDPQSLDTTIAHRLE